MQIGNTIRKYRKEKALTQEEMAARLGVSTPAVNKWENNNSYPDITLLAPLARLLDISLDTLFAFQENLSADEINAIILEAEQLFKTESYADVFHWIKSKLETYPNCLTLIWQLSSLLDTKRLFQPVPNADQYDDYILKCYRQVLETDDEALRTQAADSLFSYYLRTEQYDIAESYLSYFSLQDPQRKIKQAILFQKMGRPEDAYRASEELLFSGYQTLSLTLHNLYLLSMEENDRKKAHFFTEKQASLAHLFEMGTYQEVSCKLELATVEKDIPAVLDLMETMLESVEQIAGYTASPLYEHMDFKPPTPAFFQELKQNLIRCFLDETTYGFLKDEERWKNIKINFYPNS